MPSQKKLINCEAAIRRGVAFLGSHAAARNSSAFLKELFLSMEFERHDTMPPVLENPIRDTKVYVNAAALLGGFDFRLRDLQYITFNRFTSQKSYWFFYNPAVKILRFKRKPGR